MSPVKSDFHQPNTRQCTTFAAHGLAWQTSAKKTKTPIIIFLNSYSKFSTKLFFCTVFGIIFSKEKSKKKTNLTQTLDQVNAIPWFIAKRKSPIQLSDIAGQSGTGRTGKMPYRCQAGSSNTVIVNNELLYIRSVFYIYCFKQLKNIGSASLIGGIAGAI